MVEKVKQEQYWNISSLTPEALTASEAIDVLWENLTFAVARISQRFDRVVCDLTGGYDSRAIAAAFERAQRSSLQSYPARQTVAMSSFPAVWQPCSGSNISIIPLLQTLSRPKIWRLLCGLRMENVTSWNTVGWLASTVI